MHLVMISDLESAGGAAVAASRLADGLCSAGHRVTRIIGRRPKRLHNGPYAVKYVETNPPMRSAVRVVTKVAGPEIGSTLKYAIQRRLLEKYLRSLKPDVINVHNIHGVGWTTRMLDICCRFAPVAWTLHDMWSFTGRCAYNGGCDKYLNGCDATCPTPNEYPALRPERIRLAWGERKDFFQRNPQVVAVAPSRWLAETAKRGLWGDSKVSVIPYGIPTDHFFEVAPPEARRMLGISDGLPTLLMAAQRVSEQRKGLAVLLDALRAVKRRPLQLLVLGKAEEPMSCDGVHVHSLGYINEANRLRIAYSAADAFVHPAAQDNLPNVILESMACGTPVVGFPIGGVPDMVRPSQTGWLAARHDSESLAVAIYHALSDIGQGNNLRENCREVIQREYSAPLQVQRYLDLFQELISRQGNINKNPSPI